MSDSIRVVCKGEPKTPHTLVELTQLVDGDLVPSDRASLVDGVWQVTCTECPNAFDLPQPSIAEIAAFIASHSSTLQADGDDGLTLTAFTLRHIIARLATASE